MISEIENCPEEKENKIKNGLSDNLLNIKGCSWIEQSS